MTAAILRYDPPLDAPGPQGSDKKGCTGIVMLAVAFLGALLALATGRAAKATKATEQPDPGRCPRCGFSFWDCNCPNSGEE